MNPIDKINSEVFEKHIKEKLDPSKHEALDRIVTAGMKVMFGKDTHNLMIEQLDGEGDMVQKTAEGVTKLMVILYQQSNNTMPMDLVVPAASILLAKTYDFLEQSGDYVSEDDMAQSLKIMTKLILREAGADDAQLDQLNAQKQTSPKPSGLINSTAGV